MEDGITPIQKQVDHAENMIERTFSNYPDAKRLQRAMGNADWKKRLWALADELGFDPTKILERARFEVYGKFLGFDCPDLTQLAIPAPRNGFNWIRPIVAIHEKAPNEAAFQQLKKQFGDKAWKYTDKVLDEVIKDNDRDPLKSGPYVIRARDRVEADEELKNFSANQLTERKIAGNTLYERQILEAFHYVETGEHLDVVNVTLCSGSRGSDGSVPDYYWYNGEFRVLWYFPDDHNDNLRAREVVS